MRKMNKANMELRADGAVRLTGYVNAVERYSRPIYEDGRYFIEKISAGVFRAALADPPADGIKVKLNHGRVIASVGEEVSLTEDNIGLYADMIIRDPEVCSLARDGKLTGWSFGYFWNEQDIEWSHIGERPEHRRVNGMVLDEVSILTVTPAYIATSVELRRAMPGDAEDGLCIRSENVNMSIRSTENIDCEILDESDKHVDSKEDTGALDALKKQIEFFKLKGAKNT